MDSNELRSILSRSRIGIFDLIDTAIRVAASDDGDELLRRRDKIIESLYTAAPQLCRNCNDVVYIQNRDNANTNKISNDDDDDDVILHDNNNDDDEDDRNLKEDFASKSPLTPESNHRSLSDDDDGVDPFEALFDDEQSNILTIKEQLEDPDQSEDAVVELLQNLADMDINFQALQETDIGRHVNRLRKHSSGEVRRLVKQLVRKWKETVDEWVKVNGQGTSSLIADGDSPQQNIPKNQQIAHHKVPDFGYSPNPQNGSSTAERNYVERETKRKPTQPAPRREAPSRPPQSVQKYASAPPNTTARESAIDDDERLNSARRRLQENYQEAQNAKKQRKIQVMDIHELPKPKNGFFAKNRGGFHGRHHR